MRKIYLFLALMLTTVGAWAVDTEPVSEGAKFTIMCNTGSDANKYMVYNSAKEGRPDVTDTPDAEGIFKEWVVATVSGKKYLYSVGAQAFLNETGISGIANSKTSLTSTGTPFEFCAVDGAEGSWTIKFSGDDNGYLQFSTGYSNYPVWKSAVSGATQFTITATGESLTADQLAAIKANIPVVLTSKTELSNNKTYYLRTLRGDLVYASENPDQLSSTKYYSTIDNTAVEAMWSVFSFNGNYYLYSVAGEKFVGKNADEGGKFPLGDASPVYVYDYCCPVKLKKA